MEIVEGLLFAAAIGADNAVGACKLGHYEATAALIAHEPAKDGIGDAGHGGQDRCGGDDRVADAVAVGEVQPVLMPEGIHSSIVAVLEFGGPNAVSINVRMVKGK